LLTYPDLHNKESWERRDQPDYERVSKALAEMQVSEKFPVVLTQAQYDWGYRMTRDHEVIFVLPDQPAAFAGGAAFDIAQEAMRRVVFGM